MLRRRPRARPHIGLLCWELECHSVHSGYSCGWSQRRAARRQRDGRRLPTADARRTAPRQLWEDRGQVTGQASRCALERSGPRDLPEGMRVRVKIVEVQKDAEVSEIGPE